METASGRRVRSGKEYEHLFPQPNGKDTNIKKSADVTDTISFIQRIVPLTLNDTKKVADLKKGKSLYETCSNYWHFLYDHVPYKKDEEGVEQIRRPARTWWDRMARTKEKEAGVDCDCYSTFLSSMLTNAGIAHKYRITKYPKLNGETPRWQHIYVVVPKDGKLDYDLSNRDDYIVMDCVKHNFDDEQPYLERKDFNMRLDYLNGLEEEEFVVPAHADAKDMAAIYDEEDLGKIGQWARKAIKNVGTEAKKVEKVAGTVVHDVAKVAISPLRNSLLLAMKENFLNASKRIRYAYLSDAQAAKKGINLTALNALRKVKDKIEDIYQGAGGNKSSFQAAVLKGKGNKDKAVQLAGLNGFGEICADQDEYNILHDNSPLEGLGSLGILPAVLAPAVAAVTALAKVLSQVKGLFPAGSPAEKDMSNSTSPSDMGSGSSNDTDTITEDDATTSTNSNSLPSTAVRSASRGNRVPSNAAQTPDGSNLTPSTLTQDTPQAGGVIGFVQANPVVATGIVAAGITAYYFVKHKNASRSGSLAGFDRRVKKKKVKRSKQQKTFKAVQI